MLVIWQIHTETLLSLALLSLRTEWQERRSGLMSRNEASHTQVAGLWVWGTSLLLHNSRAVHNCACVRGREGQEICMCGSNAILTNALRWKTATFAPNPAVLFIYLRIYFYLFLREIHYGSVAVLCNHPDPPGTSMDTSAFCPQSRSKALFSSYLKQPISWRPAKKKN